MSQTFLEDIPEFLEIQRNSFLRVLDTGLIQALEKINPIVSTSQSECGLLFYPKEYVLVLPENTITEAFLQGKTYGCKIYVPAVIYEKEKKSISNSINLKSWSSSASFGASEALVQRAISLPFLAKHSQGGPHMEGVKPYISQNLEKQKQVDPKFKALTKTLGSTLWPVIAANAWPRRWPISYKGFKTKDIKNNLFRGERGYGILVGLKSKASKGSGPVHGVLLHSMTSPNAEQAKESTTKRYFSSLFISIGCDAKGSTVTKKSLWVKNNGPWSLGTMDSRPSISSEPPNRTKREQCYLPNKNQNYLIVVGASASDSTRTQRSQVLSGAKRTTKTTIKNHGYFTFGLSFLSFGHFLRNLMCNSTLSECLKTNNSKANFRFSSKEAIIQQKRESNKKNNQIPFGLSQSSAYLNQNTNLDSKISIPSWSSRNHISQNQVKNFVHDPKAEPLQLLRYFERRCVKSQSLLQLKDLLKRTNKHFIDSSIGIKETKIPIRYTVLARKRHGEQITKENFITSPKQVIYKNTLITSEKKINPLSRKEWVCIGVLPLMTPRGHFIINGSHRIVVSQMGRAPGLYYQIGDKLQATIVPAKGAWLRMSVKQNDSGEVKVWVRITPQRKIPYKIFLETYKYLENLKSPENPQFKFLNLTYKAINSKIKHFDKHYALGVISGQIQRTLLNFTSYNLGTLGRKRINERLSIKEKKGYLTSKDISLIKRNLLKHLGQNPTAHFDDDIDHLQNRRVRTCGELLQSEIEVGMTRLKKTASKQLEDYANSNLSIIEKGSLQLKPKPLSSSSLGVVGVPSDAKASTPTSDAMRHQHQQQDLGKRSVPTKGGEFSYSVTKDFNRKINVEPTKSSVILSQGLRSKVLTKKSIPFLTSVKSLGQSFKSWSFKQSSLLNPSVALAPGQNRHYYGPWLKPLTIPGGYLDRGLKFKNHKDYSGQGLKPLFLRRSHHQNNGGLSLSSWLWSLQQKDKPLEQPRLLPLGHSLSWWRSRRQIKDTGVYVGIKNQYLGTSLQTQDFISVPLKKTLGFPFRAGVNLLSTRAHTKALNSSWGIGRALLKGVDGDFDGQASGLQRSALQRGASSQNAQHGLSGAMGSTGIKRDHAKPKTLVRGHNGLWSWCRQGPLAEDTSRPKSQIQSSQVLGKESAASQIENGEQLKENCKKLPTVVRNKHKGGFSFAVSAPETTGGNRSWFQQSGRACDPLGRGATTLNLEKSKQKKWSPYKVISTKAFAGALREFFGSNPLSQYMDQTNPLAEITHKRRLSSLGPGGVDRASAGIAIRGIHPSHYGRICPIETPEGKNAGLVNSMTMWARVNEDGFLETPYLKVKGGSIMSHTNTLSPDWYFVPTKKETRAFPDVQLSSVSSTYSKAYSLSISKFGNDLGSENQKHQKLNAVQQNSTTSKMIKIVTSDLNISESSFLPNISIPTRDGAERSFERAKRAVVNFCGVSPTQNISVATSLIPFLEHDDATRALMGSNMQRQAVPLLKPQGPLVRTGLEGKVVGESGHALQAICSGVISTATRTLISIETFQTRNWSDPNLNLKESCSFLPQTYINTNKSLSFLRKKSNHGDRNAFGLNFGTMPPLLYTSSWGHSAGEVSKLGGYYLTSKLPIPNFCEALRWKGLRLSAFKIKTTRKENKKKLQTTFYNYTFGPKEYTYETTVSPRHNKQMPLVYSVGWSCCEEATHALVGSGGAEWCESTKTNKWCQVMPCGINANSALQTIGTNSEVLIQGTKGYVKSETQPNIQNKNLLKAINFGRVTELISQYNFISLNKNPNSSTSVSRDPLWFEKDGHAKVQTRKTLAFNTVYSYQNKNSNSYYASRPQKEQKALSNKHKDFWPTNVTPIFDSQGLLCHNMSKNLSRKSPLIERKTKTQKLQEYARSNQATICVQRPAVKAGDWVQKGDLIGDCSASVNGVLSLGKNIVVAYLPMEGFNFEDAIVVSDRLVHEELYTSIHVQRVEFDMDAYVKKYIPKKIKIKKQKAAYKTTGQDWITKHNPHLLQTEKELLNPLGIIKVGSWVGPGDVLVSKVVPVDRKIAPSRHLLLAVFQEKRTKTLDTDDTSLRVPKGIHGRVINVKVVGNGTVIPLDRNKLSLKKTISTKREKSLPFFTSGNKAQLGALMGLEEPFWPLAKFDLALPLAQVMACGPSAPWSEGPQAQDQGAQGPQAQDQSQSPVTPTGSRLCDSLRSTAIKTTDFSAQNHSLKDPSPARLQRDEAPNKPNAEQNSLKAESFALPLRKLRAKAYDAGISKTLLRQDVLTRFPNVTQDLKQSNAAGILNILHQLKKTTNQIDVSIDRHSRAFAVAKKVAFFPSFLLEGEKAHDFDGDFSEQTKTLSDAMGSTVINEAGQAKIKNLTETGPINFNVTKQNKGYSEHPESLNKSTTLERKQIDGEYKIIQVRIYIAERKKLQVGDKMSGRHGNKGIVSTILPREDMPFLPDGTPVDMVLNPLGIPSRMNVGQVFECLLGLASSVCGEIIGHTPFDEMYGPEASRSLVYLFLYLARLRARTDWLFQPNFPGKTIVFDGRTGLPFEQWVTVGRAYMLKLIHMVDEKIHARSIGPRSLVTQQPVKGRARGGGQRLGEMELWALEGFGAAYTLQEILTLKSDDIRGRENVENSIIFSTTAKAHIPETFRMMLFELRCLCLNVELN